MRTIWNGSLSFGLVNIPIGLALATSPKARASDVSFRQLHRECRTPIRQKRWCPTHDREVGPDEIVKGWEVAKGEFVIIEDADLEAIQLADDSRAIDITRFVPIDQVDPVYFDRTYYLSPANTVAQRRPYVLVPGQGPAVVAFQVHGGARLPQRLVGRVGIGQDIVGEDVHIGYRGSGRSHP